MTIMVTDVTEQRRAQRRVRATEARFRALIEKSTDMVLILDASGTIQLWSPSATEALGWSADEVLGRPGLEFMHPDDVAQVGTEFGRAASEPGATVHLVFRHRHKDGSWRLLEAFGRNLLADPDVRGIVVNTRDVTQQRRLEEMVQQAQKLDSIGRLAGGVAHDFNNLLTVILSCADALADDVAAGRPAQADEIAEIRDAAGRARDLTRQLLMFARRQVVAPAVLELNEVVGNTEKLLRRLLGEDVDLSVRLAPGLWPVRADASRLEQILMNLAANARDAMPNGGTLRLETANVPREDVPLASAPAVTDFVRLTLRDSGVGMPPEVQAHLFEPFFTTKPTGQGTGLGLSTVYGLVRQMDGHVLVESEPGRGTSFDVYLPRAAGTVAKPAPRPAASAAGGETIVVVEDESAVRNAAVRALRAAGYQVLVAASGREAIALAAAQATPPQLLLTDVVMPGLDGRAVAEELRRRHPSLRVLYMSGYTQDAVRARGVLDGGAQFVQKPFSPASLVARVRAALDGR
jgi:PAS domain S-box-containing protein